MRIGATFSATNARWLGLDARRALTEVIDLGLDPLRLCGYWDQPPDDLDWQLELAARAGRQVLLTVGMKAPRWPEFHFPAGVDTGLRHGGELNPEVGAAAAAVRQVVSMVERFRDRPCIAWWQVENEPLNRSGPHRWWISPAQLAAEIDAVRALDERPIVLTAFGHVNRAIDELSGHVLLNEAALRGDGSGVEPELMARLRPGDVLGLDIYHAIGYPAHLVVHADPPGPYLERQLAQARAAGVECWVTELQAEPWEASNETLWDPRTVRPQDLADRLTDVERAGVGTILLWGVEYWLAQNQRGDATWLDGGRRALAT